MAEVNDQDLNTDWQAKAKVVGTNLLKNWYLLILAAIIGGVIGYVFISKVKPVYTSNFTFVLSTEQRPGGGNLAGLASQLGVDVSSGTDNIFSGDNIVELFKSRLLIGNAVQMEIDSVTHQTLLNYITQTEYPDLYRTLGPFGKTNAVYTAKQNRLYRRILTEVGNLFLVFKKDKKLIFYVISATSTNPNISYYVSRCMLYTTSRYFIDTKTKVSTTGLKLLQHEADSLTKVLSSTLASTATMNDHTYNLNPSLSVQRTGVLFNQAKMNAFGNAYAEVMRNLEVSKMNLQRETPLYRIIDEPELPLPPIKESILKHTALTTLIAFLLMAVTLVVDYLYKPFIKKK